MVEHTKSSSTHSHHSSDSVQHIEHHGKTRMKHRSIDHSDGAESRNTSHYHPRESHDHRSRSKSDHISVIDYDPSLLLVDFYCNYCNQSLSVGGFRIRCAECVDYDQCINCAVNLKYTDPHQLSHNYVPIGPNTFELFKEGWTADEELMLLEGISKYGFGNWKQVAEMVNKVNTKMKSPSDCENHYYDTYISSTSSPYPDVRSLRTPIKCGRTRDSVYKYFDQAVKSHRRIEHPDSEDSIQPSEISGSHSTYIPPPINLLHVEHSKVKFFQNFTGYNIYRDELENEYNPDAEFLLKDVEFEKWDSPSEVHFKVQLVDLYNGFLDERIYRKRILMHRFWNDYVIRDAAMLNMTDLEKMLYWRLSPLLRFHTEEDHINLTKLLIAKIELEKRLEIVQQWNSLGLKSIEDVQQLDTGRMVTKAAPARHTGLISKISQVSSKIAKDGVIHKDELSKYINEINDKFCNEFYITRSHLDDILTSVSNEGADPEFSLENPMTRLWDVSFEDFSLERNNFFPTIISPPNLSLFPDNSTMRVILDPDKEEHDLSEMNLKEVRFGNFRHNAQQSNVLPQRDSLFYFTRFLNDRLARVQKNLQKPKTGVQPTAKRKIAQRR